MPSLYCSIVTVSAAHTETSVFAEIVHQFLMDLQNSFITAKSTKFPTKPIVGYPPRLMSVAALPWKTTRAHQLLRWATVWPQYSWAEKLRGAAVRGLGPHQAQCGLDRGLPLYQVAS